MPLRAIDPILLPGGALMPFQVIPPVDVQEQAERSGQPLSFFMGGKGGQNGEEPRHRVIIPQPFYLGTTPVTQAQFAAWTTSNQYKVWRKSINEGESHENHFRGHPRRPAESMTWYEANAYTGWLNELADAGRIQLPPGIRASLPDEARWEYSCRAGTTTEYWSGDGESALRMVGWFSGNCGQTEDVAQLPANPWGLRDMHGNVWEWCEDAFDDLAYSKRPDGWLAKSWEAKDSDPFRVVRGGSWFTDARWCRSAFRFGWHPRGRNWIRGFRVLLSAPGPAAEPERRVGTEARREPERGTSEGATGRPEWI